MVPKTHYAFYQKAVPILSLLLFGEEWGLLGALCILILYLALFFRSFYLARLSHHYHAQLLAIGLVLPTIIATLTNISMVLGLLPVVGIPLPLASYGMTNLITTMTSLGWLNGISMHSAAHHTESVTPYAHRR